MNYTSNDLGNITFKKAIIYGYSKSQVYDVLAKIIEDYNTFLQENKDLKTRVSVLNETIQHYKTIEESLQHTLLIAQHTSENIKKNACEKSNNIIKEAEIKAEKLINDANQEVAKIKLEYEEMRKRLMNFKSRSETLLLSQIEILKQPFEE